MRMLRLLYNYVHSTTIRDFCLVKKTLYNRILSDMFGEAADQCAVFEALIRKCQHRCQVQSGDPVCV